MPVKVLVVFLMFGLMALTDENVEKNTSNTEVEVPEEEPELPSLEFLEFLGEWEIENGQWIGPEEIEEIAPPEDKEDEEKVIKN